MSSTGLVSYPLPLQHLLSGLVSLSASRFWNWQGAYRGTDILVKLKASKKELGEKVDSRRETLGERGEKGWWRVGRAAYEEQRGLQGRLKILGQALGRGSCLQ